MKQPLFARIHASRWRRIVGPIGLLAFGLGSVGFDGPKSDGQAQASGGNVLEQMEATLIATLRAARPSVATIEGRIPLPRFSRRVRASKRIQAPPVPSAPKVNGDKSPTDDQQRTIEDALKNADKTAQEALEMARKELSLQGGTPVTGSGFLMQGGLILTTAEVTQGMRDPSITLADGKHATVDWIHPDPRSNIAVIKVSGVDPNQGLKWGDSDRVFPGSFTLIIGNQAGFPNSVALGMVSGTGRSGRSGPYRYTNLIQFQGAVGSGGSGGPLLNARGEVVGMIVATPASVPGNAFQWHMQSRVDEHEEAVQRARVAIQTTDQQATFTVAASSDNDEKYLDGPKQHVGRHKQNKTKDENANADDEEQPEPPAPPAVFLFGGVANTGFALPANDMKPVVERLSKPGENVLKTGWVGVKVSKSELDTPGALIDEIVIGSPADRGGMQPGDIVIAVNGQPVRNHEDMVAMVQNVGAGEAMRVEVVRAMMRKTLTLTIEAKPDDAIIKRMRVRKHPDQTG